MRETCQREGEEKRYIKELSAKSYGCNACDFAGFLVIWKLAGGRDPWNFGKAVKQSSEVNTHDALPAYSLNKPQG